MPAAENKAVIQSMFEAFERRDEDALYAGFADDVVWSNHATSSPFHGAHNGIAAVR